MTKRIRLTGANNDSLVVRRKGFGVWEKQRKNNKNKGNGRETVHQPPTLPTKNNESHHLSTFINLGRFVVLGNL